MLDYNMSKDKQMVVNILSSLIAFAVNLIINFFLSPYIVNTLGVEANGFISLANTFITYASLVTIALNSMAGRFITIEIHKDNLNNANKYYNAVFFGNLIISTALVIPAIICIFRLEKFINISPELIFDVKILFSILFINFFVITAAPKWSIATFATNKLYLQSFRAIESNLLKAVLILFLFMVFSPHVYFVGLVTLITTLFVTFFDWYYHNKLLSILKIKKEYFEMKAVVELICAGSWNTLTQAGQMLLSGLDLLIANLLIGSTAMGVLALAKTIPNVITNLAGTLTSVFAPSLTIDYAKGDSVALKNSLKQGMKLTGVILTIPLAILIIFGGEFYSLWVPNENATVLQILSVLTCFGLIFTSGTQCLYNIFTVVNKVKINSILLLISGCVSTIVVFILLKTTSLGIFAIAGVSSCINLIRNMVYTVPFTAKYLNYRWNTFFPEVLSSVVSVIMLSIIGYIIKLFIVVDSWLTLIIACIFMGIVGVICNYFVVLNKEEKIYFIRLIKKRIKR